MHVLYDISVLTEITEFHRISPDETYSDRRTLHPALGRARRDMGGQSDGFAVPRSPLPGRPAAPRRRNLGNARRSPLQRQHQPARAPELEAYPAGPPDERPPRSL